MHRGYIKLWRKIDEWTWYADSKTLLLFIHLLMNANYKETNYMGYVIPRGSLVIGLHSLSKRLKISFQSIRTSIKRLKSTNDITIKSTNKFSVVSIVNYEQYQDKPTSNPTRNQQSTNNQLTTSKEGKKEKKIYARPNIKEVVEYFSLIDLDILEAEKFFDFYESNGWIQGKGKKIKDWKAAGRNWKRNIISYKPACKSPSTAKILDKWEQRENANKGL